MNWKFATLLATALFVGCESHEAQLEKCSAAYGEGQPRRACLIMKYGWDTHEAYAADQQATARLDSSIAAFKAGLRQGESERLYGTMPPPDTTGIPVHQQYGHSPAGRASTTSTGSLSS